jgi:hypothetical protein
MSENRNDDAQQTGERIGTLPASDQEMNNSEKGGGGSRSGQPSPEATQPSPEATQPSPDSGDAQRSMPPPPHDPEG